MQAIVEIAGKQFKVASNDKLKVPFLSSKEGDKVNFDKVHMFEDDKGKITFGTPLVSNMSVAATVIEHGREKKIVVFKKKRRKGYQKKNGHKQDYSIIEINTIGAAKASTKKATAEKPAKAEEKKAPAKAKAKTVKKATKSQAAPKKAAAAKKATTTEKTTAAKPAVKKAAAPKKTETAKKTTAAAKPKATKTAAAKPKTAAKKAESKPKAKED